MLRRLLSLLGFSWYIPDASEYGGERTPQTDGKTHVSFVAGNKTAVGADAAEQTDDRRDRTDNDIVWPGKTETIHVRNDEPVDYRYDLTVPGLDTKYYIKKPPVGGTPSPEGGVILQPNEEATFEIVFLPLSTAGKTSAKTFSLVITVFDPGRLNDNGEVLDDLPMRWVGLPANSDLQITSPTKEVVMRPWRRTALFQIDLHNHSDLPPSVNLMMQRAPTKQALNEHSDPVGTIIRTLDARTPGTWHWVLPPTTGRNSYFATVNGTAKVVNKTEFTLSLPHPLYARYVPWLHTFKDWLVLLGGLFMLLWLVFGIPMPKAPEVRVKLAFPGGQLPDGVKPDDLDVRVIPRESTGDGTPVSGEFEGNEYVFRKLPGRWYGKRIPFGWSDSEPYKFSVVVTLRKAENAQWFRDIALDDKYPGGGRFYEIGPETRPFLGAWNYSATVQICRKAMLSLKIHSDDLGAATGQADKVVLRWSVDGKDDHLDVAVPQKDKLPETVVLLPDLPAGIKSLAVTATTYPYQVHAGVTYSDVKPSTVPIIVSMPFGKEKPKVFLNFSTSSVPFLVAITNLEDSSKNIGPISTESGIMKPIPVEVLKEGMKIIVRVASIPANEHEDQVDLGGGTFTLSTDPTKNQIDVKVNAPPPAAVPAAPSTAPGGSATSGG